MNNWLDSKVQNISFDFVKSGNIACFVSIVFIFSSVILYSTQGINLGVDFTGGQVFEIKSLDAPFDIESIKNELNERYIRESVVYSLGNRHEIVIKLKGKAEVHKIKEIFSSQKVQYDKIDYVGPQVSFELIFKGLMSVGLALAGMFAYLLLRFNWYFALSGIIGLIHDVILSVGFCIITQMEFNIPSVAAILTIIGYSINDSVVIFDRIREYLLKDNKERIINRAIHSTLIRTILTSLTTALAALPLVVIGKGTLHDFSLIILFGVFVGTYSSIFISGPLLRFHHS